MTPKEKAENIVDEYYKFLEEFFINWHLDVAKQCTLIAIEEIVASHTYGLSPELKKFWEEVKQETEKL